MHLDSAKLPFGRMRLHAFCEANASPKCSKEMGGKALHAGDQSENSTDRLSKKYTNTEKDRDR
jgi:hypothetical protein